EGVAVLRHQLADAVRNMDIILAQHVGDGRGADLKLAERVEIDFVDRPAGRENVDHHRLIIPSGPGAAGTPPARRRAGSNRGFAWAQAAASLMPAPRRSGAVCWRYRRAR